jgi:hypothetical protein
MTDPRYVEAMPFLSHDPAFAHGFECGIVYQQMRAAESHIVGMFHATNEEQLRLMAHRLGYASTKREEREGWIDMVFVVDG